MFNAGGAGITPFIAILKIGTKNKLVITIIILQQNQKKIL